MHSSVVYATIMIPHKIRNFTTIIISELLMEKGKASAYSDSVSSLFLGSVKSFIGAFID